MRDRWSQQMTLKKSLLSHQVFLSMCVMHNTSVYESMAIASSKHHLPYKKHTNSALLLIAENTSWLLSGFKDYFRHSGASAGTFCVGICLCLCKCGTAFPCVWLLLLNTRKERRCRFRHSPSWILTSAMALFGVQFGTSEKLKLLIFKISVMLSTPTYSHRG